MMLGIMDMLKYTQIRTRIDFNHIKIKKLITFVHMGLLFGTLSLNRIY
jgi:hypothetical protein